MTIRTRVEDATGLSAARLVIYAVAALVALGLAWFVIDRLFLAPGRAREAAATAKVERKVGETAVATGKDALATTERVIERNTRVETLTRENTTRILAAPGANDTIPAAVDAAWLASICARDGRGDDPQCIGAKP